MKAGGAFVATDQISTFVTSITQVVVVPPTRPFEIWVLQGFLSLFLGLLGIGRRYQRLDLLQIRHFMQRYLQKRMLLTAIRPPEVSRS